MHPLLPLLLFLSLLLPSQAFPVICLDPIESLVVSLDCSSPKIFKLSTSQCTSVYQPMEISLSETTRFFFFEIELTEGFPLNQLTRDELSMVPVLAAIISSKCPGFPENLGGALSKNSVFLSLLDASQIPGTDNKKDGSEQFFDRAKSVFEFEFEADPSLTVHDLISKFGFQANLSDLTVSAAKLYWRFTSYLPKDKIAHEMQQARENPTTHIPNVWWCFVYFILKYPITQNLKYEVRHEVLEVCIRNEEDKMSYHFVVDRQAKVIPSFHSQIRIIYTGKGDSCSLESPLWSDIKTGDTQEGKPQLNLRKGKEELGYSFNKMIRVATEYLTSYPVFNTLYNCQHFATNTFNLIAKENLDFESWDIMGAHSVFSEADGVKLAFVNLNEVE